MALLHVEDGAGHSGNGLQVQRSVGLPSFVGVPEGRGLGANATVLMVG
jgi:hypothetical protein